MRKNAKIHKKIFDEIKKITKEWTNRVLCWFKWVYWFPDNICISVNDEVVHWRASRNIVFKNWDLVTFDFWIKDKWLWINTDAAISLVVWWDDKNPRAAKLIQTNKKGCNSKRNWVRMIFCSKRFNRTCYMKKTSWNSIYTKFLKSLKMSKIKSMNDTCYWTYFMRK